MVSSLAAEEPSNPKPSDPNVKDLEVSSSFYGYGYSPYQYGFGGYNYYYPKYTYSYVYPYTSYRQLYGYYPYNYYGGIGVYG